jgi:hypothetical protein
MRDLIITLVVVALLAGGGWYWYQNYYTPPVVVAPPADLGGPTLELVERLRSVRIDTSLFSDPIFLQLAPAPALILENFTKGRTNPFAPIR